MTKVSETRRWRATICRTWLAVAGFLGLAIALSEPAQIAGQTTARALLDEARELSQTTRKWTDRTQQLKLKIIDRRGGERNREVEIKFKKYPEDRSRSIVFFRSPTDVKGVGMLQWANPKGKDEQWLYLPELGKPRQIAGAAKKESFVGTDFSYEDLAIITQIIDWTESEANCELLRDEDIDNQRFHVVELVPTGKDLSYGKVDVWMRADDLLLLRFDMLDASGQRLKHLVMSDVRNVGSIPTPFRMEMRNEQNGSRTTVEFTEIKYDSGLADDELSQRALEHGPQ
ncbi:MAG: outer membrane lipoprotein-sorting protein [Deltaproteobacteria bacterium]|nr:outer membrane lipoprotein-sorting protein [Deltaproteobacteria bacterium]